jgi:hypothetical protein
MAQSIDQSDECGRGLAAAWVVEMIAIPIRRIFLQDLDQPPFLDVRPDDFFRNVGKTKAVERTKRVERSLA